MFGGYHAKTTICMGFGCVLFFERVFVCGSELERERERERDCLRPQRGQETKGVCGRSQGPGETVHAPFETLYKAWISRQRRGIPWT